MSSIEFLKQFAIDTNRKLKHEIEPYKLSPNSQLVYYRIMVEMSNIDNRSHYLAFADPRALGMYSNFSGVFFSTNISSKTHLQFRSKDFLDKLNLLSRFKELNTGDKDFDNKIHISGNDHDQILHLFTNKIIQDLILKSLSLDTGMHIVINEAPLNFSQFFKSKSHMGIVSKQQWILNPETMESMFTLCELMQRID